MANWSSLRPLKNHSRLMSFTAIILAAILVVTPLHAFKPASIENNGTMLRVNAARGLSIRNEPDINSTVLTTAPNHATLTVIDKSAALDNIGGKKGSWYKVEYQGVTGYAWGNYIDK
jgi:hypothetical protein